MKESIKEPIKELWNFSIVEKHDKWKNKLRGTSYLLDKRIIGLTVFFCLVVLAYAWGTIGYSIEKQIYVHCPEDALLGYCENPLYGQCEQSVCNLKTLPAGYEYGNKPSGLFENIPLIIIGLLAIGFLLNHLIHNRNYDSEEKS